MYRVPNTGPAERDRQRLIRKLEATLRVLDAIPPKHREAELADSRAELCLRAIDEVKRGR
jgi:hypothetical protein